jgi:hypothetical protein
MTTFRQLVTDVIKVTNRPDLLAETELAIKGALLAYHHLDFFWRDRAQVILNVTSSNKTRIEIPLERCTDMRSPQEVAPYYADSECCGTPLARLHRIGEHQCNYWMLTPSSLIINSATPTHQFRFSYWRNPDLQEATFNSWVADIYPDAVIDAACAKLFEMVRDNTTADRYRARVGNTGAIGTHCHRILSDQLEQDIRGY